MILKQKRKKVVLMNKTQEHKFPYNWTLKDAIFTKDKGKVFSCFACGGGSTMGYKLAGFDVIGCNEIDPKMMEIYKANHNPKYSFLEPIQTFKNRDDLPQELYELDILDGSPPCSSFSMAGNREADWGKEKKFREGQSKQVLDTLFFDFIDLAKKLQPKIVIAENVKGLIIGKAKEYVKRIYWAFEEAGYYCQLFLLDASKMGVPQRRERVFFIALRKDLATPFLDQYNLFEMQPKLELEFNEKAIPFKDISFNGIEGHTNGTLRKYWHLTKVGRSVGDFHLKGSFFSYIKVDPDLPMPTIAMGHGKTTQMMHYYYERYLNDIEILRACTFPSDYQSDRSQYVAGMSVPPVVTAQIATKLYEQWRSIF
jgi:DNA (cytosine-5)-methyltransferase 1